MKFTVWLPCDVFLDEEAAEIRAEAEDGWFCLLPRHVDFVTSLVPGILSFDSPGKGTEYVAIDHGILVKCGPEVTLSTRSAVRSVNLAELKQTVEQQFRILDEKEQASHELEARLEADLVKGLLVMEKHE